MKVSVVTVCRNAQATIAGTLESFFAQDHPDKELVVVDGASTDGTLAIVRGFAHPAMTVISERDAGLYDAMNKGLGAFTGDAVGFLNADDRFADAGALAAIDGALGESEVAYGDLDVVRPSDDRIVRRWRSTAWRKGAFRQGWMPPHPTFYCRRVAVARIGRFDLGYRLAADYDFMLRALELHDFRVARLERVLVRMGDGGRSSAGLRARLQHNLEALAARRRWLGAGLVDAALIAKPARKLAQFAALHGRARRVATPRTVP